VPLLPWDERPVELANLLNPAFCALLIRDAIGGYRAQASQALPYPLAYLVLPLVLYPPARAALPRSTAALLHAWIQDHPALQLQVADRAQRMLSYTREAILFALQHELLRISDDGGLDNGARRIRDPYPDPAQTEPADCRKAAGLVGRWFGKVADASLILAMWGLKP
jgi:Family of unknown function (DUF6521)